MNFLFCGEIQSSSARNNHVTELIPSSRSGFLENLISHKSNENFNQIILVTLSSEFIIAICSSLSIFTNSKFILFGLYFI